jgi:DNA-binding Lrp family transcriptional regulator
MLDATDRRIINELQGGLPVCERPYAAAGAALGIGEGELLDRLQRMLASGTLSRFGPMYNADRMGGAFCLCAMSVPAADFERTVALVNGWPEVAHNYERAHALNLWFVLASETRDGIADAIAAIERETGYPVYAFPKLQEFFVGLKVDA